MLKELVCNHIKVFEIKSNQIMSCLETPFPTNKLVTYTVSCIILIIMQLLSNLSQCTSIVHFLD